MAYYSIKRIVLPIVFHSLIHFKHTHIYNIAPSILYLPEKQLITQNIPYKKVPISYITKYNFRKIKKFSIYIIG